MSFPPQRAMILTMFGIGVPISTQLVRNLIAGRLSGPNAEERMKTLVADFLSIEGNRCAFLGDDGDLTAGVIISVEDASSNL